ncbi:MAG: SDR family NAD(P)-dependent oxidoreductase, partial [Acidimicrobiia bacterium]|nr:SDR family NAD(P)-dependent oxidoreductase [Acidimicrobiia bacterium]
MEIAGASAIVTGGASGLGGATAQRLAAAGMKVVVVDLNEAAGEAMASEINGAFVKADVQNEEEVNAAVAAAVEMAPLRALVN